MAEPAELALLSEGGGLPTALMAAANSEANADGMPLSGAEPMLGATPTVARPKGEEDELDPDGAAAGMLPLGTAALLLLLLALLGSLGFKQRHGDGPSPTPQSQKNLECSSDRSHT